MTRLAAPRSLQGRLIAMLIVVVTGVWLAAATLTWIDARHELGELLDSHLAQAAALLVAQQAREVDDDALADAPNLYRYATHVAFQVWNGDQLLLHSVNAPHLRMSIRDRGFETRTIDGTVWRVFAARGGAQNLQVFVGEQIGARDDILATISANLLAPLALMLPLLALGSWWAVRAALVPLRRLGTQISARPAHSLEPVQVAEAPSEMAPLLAALNGLFERMAAMLESERRFTADAAHELRTPIAAIRIQAQVAMANATTAERARALQATVAGCDRAAHLVDQLLQLARLESAAAPLGIVDLAAIARRKLAELFPSAIGKDQTLDLDAPPQCLVAGDEALVGVLIRNLADNAIRYSGRGARIAVGVRAGPVAELRIEDSGPGLSAPDQARLGERFFRGLGTDAPGSGLGWSIVQRIARVHGLQIQVQSSQRLGGLAVHVRWPQTSTPAASSA